MIRFEIPVRTVNALNTREHWAKRARRARHERLTGEMLTREAIGRRSVKSTVITLTRLAPRRMDSDGVAASCKNLRDGIADALGISDGDPGIRWEYGQEKAKDYAVMVEIA